MLTAGTWLGSYEVVGSLGAGGMGEVYRARDHKLQRDVAVKILPDVFAADPDRVRRFEREAQALAAVNHPNIAQVFGILDVPPSSQTSHSMALAMELVEGEDLAERLKRGPISLDDIVPIARQIADALEAAHERGIVHRDLKPANIKMRDDGTVKVLDFGLAKALEGATAASGVHNQASEGTPTFTSPALMTQTGIVIGTAAYMAPEQARGKPVDRRADIWAYGVLLFEMLTGRPLFAGETVSETLAAVIKDDVRLDALPPDTSAPIRDLLARCLERDPRLRLRDIGEARVTLSRPAATMVEAASSSLSRRPRWRSPLFAATGVVVLFAAGAFAGWGAGSRTATAPPLPVQFTFLADQLGEGAIVPAPSPDGRHIALVGGNGVWVRPADGTELRQLVADVQPVQVFWSPDGRWIGYATTQALMKVPLDGGAPVRIADIGRLPGPFNPMGGGVWLPDGRIVFTTAFTGLMEVNSAGGDPVVHVAPATATEDFHGVTALPGGGFVTALHDGGSVDKLVALRDGTRMVLLDMKGQDLAAPMYSPTGHLLYQRLAGGGVWALPLDERSLRSTGDPFQLVEDGVTPRVSADGRVLVARAAGSRADNVPVALSLIDPGGKVVQPIGPERAMSIYSAPHLAPDGSRVAVTSGVSGSDGAWVLPLRDGLSTQVAEGPVHSVRWLPDGKELLVVKGASWCLSGNCFEIERRSLDGAAARAVAKGWSPDVSPDGKTMVYSVREGVEWALGIVPIDGSDSPKIFQGGPGWQCGPRFSPDGRYVAYMSMDAGRADVYVARYPAGEKRRVTTEGGYWPVWSRDSRRLYFARGTGVFAVNVSTSGIFSVGEETEVVSQGTLALIPALRWPAPFDLSSDGRQFLVQRRLGGTSSAPPEVHVLVDWAGR